MFTLTCLSIVGSLVCLVDAGDAAGARRYQVEEVRDLAYHEGPGADALKHRLDLYLPKGRKDYPVLLFVHGGAWRHGDKKTWFDMYGNVGRNFARAGIGAVVISYRLSPQVQHPAHVEDVARAFSWTVKNIGRYGGRADRVFISGHSAGGHLVSLLATDGEYLKPLGLGVDAIRGVIPISGVYSIPSGRMFVAAFGDDADVRKKASPLSHVNGKHPPFLILYADSDFPTCGEMSDQFCKALTKCQCEAAVQAIKQRDHITIVVRLANPDDPATQAILEFIARHGGS